ncbi:MAG TPA: GNAT family N-acetyltransferase [Ktedonobacteraceae bacterium]
MKNRQALPSDFQIRSPKTAAEIDAFFHINAKVFRPDEDTELVAERRRRYLMDDPNFHLHQLRGAFSGDTYLGGYILLDRSMCLGPARLRTGCISGVVTHPDYRHQGIATALMHDAIRIAENQQYALLFLHGVANFYQQFGYTDVLEDTPRHILLSKRLPEPIAGACTVRAATREDAPALLACYQQHYSPYLGSFAPQRTLQRQEHLLCNWFEMTDEARPLVALSPKGELHGYLLLSQSRGKLHAYEVATNTWPATLALLHAHTSLLNAEAEPPQELNWPIPPTDTTFYFLAEHLVLKSQIFTSPNGGWMARPGHLPTLVRSLLPLWQEYWQKRSSQTDWAGTFGLTVDNYTSFFAVTSSSIQPVDGPDPTSQNVMFSSQMFSQLIFGFRSLSWLLLQSGQQIPAKFIPVLNILFPLSQAWIAGSDSF